MVSVTVKYFKPGTQPPIYVAGSFSQPEWQPQEMEHTINGDNEYEFHKAVEVEAGKEYQYKFRIGPGDWWILDEESPNGTYKGSLNPAGERGDSVMLHATHDVTVTDECSQLPTTLEIGITFSPLLSTKKPLWKRRNLNTKKIQTLPQLQYLKKRNRSYQQHQSGQRRRPSRK
jgi:hypothetical protein